MKKLSLTIAFFIASILLFAEHVNEDAARKVAIQFMRISAPETVKENENLTLAPTGMELYFYVFNTDGSSGYVVVAADDKVTPILGYSNESQFDFSNIAPALHKWLEGYKDQIRDAVLYDIQPTEDITTKWESFRNGTYEQSAERGTNAVNPLVQTKWGQSPYYNAECPYDNTQGQRAVTGCVATAMAQIMKFWNYPATGIGFHSYQSNSYGTLSANFAGTTYQWSSMPNSVNSNNSAVAKIMYHCGVSVDMNYSTTASGAWVISSDGAVCAENSYKTYFGYNPNTIQGLRKANYSETSWLNLIKNELNNSRPVQYAGFGGGAGHTWVCDGYDQNDFLHMNWGWSGQADAYYFVNNLVPTSIGTGGGLGSYNSGQQAVIGIQPYTPPAAVLDLYTSITVTPNPIYFNTSFTVNADVINNGGSPYNGEYCAALFNSSGTFVKYIGYILGTNGNALQAGYHYTNGITFSDTNTVSALVSGTYYVGIFYRATGSTQWKMAGSGSYTNPKQVTVNGPVNNLKLYSSITTSPSSALVQGQSATVTVDLLNMNASAFYGQYQAFLLDLEGKVVQQVIGSYTESQGLPYNTHYLAPHINFTTSAITAPPGTYLLAIGAKPNGSSTFYYCGGDLYTNPIQVTVVAPPISPDVYEANNTAGAAYNFTAAFSGSNTQTISTVGSNCHIVGDYDYYKVNVAAGYNYVLSSRLHDAFSSTNGQTYTLDALVSFSLDGGVTWSETFDDVVSPDIYLTGASSVIFRVAPYFQGQTGSYILSVQVTRNQVSGISSESTSSIGLYPNPATEFVNLVAPQLKGWQLAITDVNGKIVFEGTVENDKQVLKIDGLPTGNYYMIVRKENEIRAKEFAIIK